MKLMIDTDPGVDDVMAIALAHALPQIELVGLTTIFGNTFVDQSSRNARFVLDMLGADLPVAKGAALPYGAESYTPSANVHGTEGLGDLAEVPQIGADLDLSAPEFLVGMAREHPGELVVCAIGPLTNIADALKLDPDFGRNLARLVIMGGAFEVRGNISPFAEANIFHDAAAADAVFASDLSIVMIGLNATMQTLLTPQDFVDMAQASPRIGGFIKHISDFYLAFYRAVGVTNGCPMHDSTAILACTHPDRFQFRQTGLRVVLEGDAIGQTVADATRKPVAVAMGCDADWAVTFAKEAMATLA